VSVLSDRINGTLLDLAACLCNKIEENQLPKVCYCGVVPGDAVAVDYISACDDEDGLAFVRLAQVYPASAVGVVNQRINNCSGGFGIEAEVGIIRSAPAWGDEGEPPGEKENLAGSVQLIDDMSAIFQAIQCCFGDQGIDYIVQNYRPTLLGGALGGSAVVMWAI
jgi:hypothetical protein